MTTVPISDIVPLRTWLQAYNFFRVRFNLSLRRTGLTPTELHRARLGPEARPGIWEGPGYCVHVGPFSVSFEVPEDFSPHQALESFNRYQGRLFSLNGQDVIP